MKINVFIIMGALIFALAALAVFFWWLYRREYNRRWKDVLHYRDLYNQQLVLNYNLVVEKSELTDKLSVLLCPTNNHIWQDGKCIKCGRAQG